MSTCLRILKWKEKQKNRGKIRSFVGVFEPADHPNGFHREYSGHLSVEFIRRRVHTGRQRACVYFVRVVALYLWNALFYCAREMSALLSLVPLFEQPRDNIVPSLIRHRSWTSHIVIRGGLCSRSAHLDSQPAIAVILA